MKKLLLFTILCFFSCQKYEPSAMYDSNLLVGKWKLSKYENQKSIEENIILEIKEGKNNTYEVYGKGPINFFSTIFEIAGNEIKLGNTSLTEIGGGAFAQKFENEFIQRLKDVKLFELETQMLHLMNLDKSKKMTFTFLNTP